MAKMVSELGADVFDDTVVEKKSRITKKQKNYIIGISITTILAIALGLVYYFAATVWLIDFQNMGYIQYAYNALPNEEGEITAQISRVLPNQDYPEDFRIPAQINGYKITKIADEAFAGCQGIKKIRMTDNIEYIGDQAFAGCVDLETIEFSNQITHIGNEAFLNTLFFENLPEDEAVYTNEVLINIGAGLLEENTALVSNPSRDMTRIQQYLDDGYHVFDMDTFTIIDENNIHTYESSNFEKANITQWIDGLFQNNSQITLVEVPETLDFVPIEAFKNCFNLEKIIINGENVKEIRESAFENCTSLTELHIPEQVESIQDFAFAGTSVPFDHLPNTITYLGKNVFEYNEEITEFTFPASLSEIPDNTFKGCINLSSFAFEDETAIMKIGASVFENTGFTSFRIPKYITNISERLFYGCENLTHVELYENVNGYIVPGTETVDRDTHTVSGTYQGVNQIRAEAFRNCPNFSSIKLYDDNGNIKPECTDSKTLYLPTTLQRTADSSSTHTYIFGGTQVETVIFPEKIINIGSYLFGNVTTLKNVVFKNHHTSRLHTIYEGAFLGCTGLEELIIPDSCTTIGMKAFEDCSNLIEVHLPDSDLLSSSFRETLALERGNHSTYTSINQSLFLNCTSLVKVNIREGISQIADLAFSNCTSLTHLVIPSSVKTIQADAFDGANADLVFYTDVATYKDNEGNPIDGDPAKWYDGWESYDFIINEHDTKTYLGNSKPDSNLGEDGDCYIDYQRWDHYTKTDGSWKEDKKLLIVEKGAPSNELGEDGNVYVDEIGWKYYVKENGVWVLQADLEREVIKDSLILSNHVVVEGQYTLSFVVNDGKAMLDGFNTLSDGDFEVTIPKTISYKTSEIPEGETEPVEVTYDVDSISVTAFFNEKQITKLSYEGTVSEFNEIVLSDNWNAHTNITSVTCSDGVVNL